MDPLFAQAWYGKGITLFNLARHEEALDCLEEAIKLEGQLSIAWTLKGRILLKFDRPREALKCFNMALKVKPSDEDARVGRQKALLDENTQKRQKISLNDKWI